MISVIIPVYNEERNIKPLLKEVRQVMEGENYQFEIIIVDDGSNDGTLEELRREAAQFSALKVLGFSRNFGQTSAFAAGISVSKGGIIVTIDGDLENDAHDIPRLVALLEKGYDLVSGWRKNRWKGRFLTRKVPSIVANSLISKISGVPLHDYGCMLNAYRREVIEGVILYGEMHRFIPAYVKKNGARIAEIEVNHRERIHGKSKYGLSRIFRVLLDLLFIKFFMTYMNRPIHFFGGIGFVSLALGFVVGLASIFLKFFADINLVRTPLPVLSALFLIVGVQLVVMGVLAEMIMRVYYESQQKTPYRIKERINF